MDLDLDTAPGGWLPASFAQRMFWLLDQIEQDRPAQNLPRLLRLRGALDAEALRESLEALIRRHGALRTAVAGQQGEVLQRVQAAAPVTLARRDLAALPPEARMPEARRAAVALAQLRFDLARPPLLRALLLRLGPEEHLLVLVLHHIAADGWSMAVIFQDLAELYAARVATRAPDLPDLPLAYTDFARWQRTALTEETMAEDLAYWRVRLRGAPEGLDLPTDRRRPPVRSHRGALHGFFLDRDLTARLKAACAREGATLFMGLLGAFQLLLSHQAGGAEDVVVGTPVAGRDDPALGRMVGCFVNTLVMRADLSGDPGFAQVLRRVREGALDAYAHQSLPFERLLAELRPARSPAHNPLFQAMFVLQNAPRQVLRLPGLEIEEVAFDAGMAKLDLTLEMVEQEGGLYGQFEYATDLFDAPTIARMAGRFAALLGAALQAPEVPVSRLPLMDPAERAAVLTAGEGPSAPPPPERRLEEAFAAQVRRTPEAVALVEGDRRWTFAALEARAGAIARRILAAGPPPGAPIGVHLPRSGDGVASMLGALKAGHPWLPLDLGQPAARLGRILAESGCPLVLTTRALRPALPDGPGILLLDDPDDATDPPPPRGEAGDLAYVIYTSGSTGAPKGVMGTHRATLNRFAWMWRAFPFAAGEVCCQKTAPGFVDSIWETFGPLLRGVPVVVVPEDSVADPEALLGLLAEAGVTRLVLVPTLLGVLLDHAPDLGARLPRLRLWITSGEALTADLARRFRAACPGAVLLNLYGSSEVAADVTWQVVEPSAEDAPVPIGRPIDNARVLVLDRHRQPLPFGVPGEIHVGGEAVAAGYWRRPDLTAERFLPDPGGAPGARIFATGDIGRLRADGRLEYLGRRDGQAKIRGVRVEPGEVEAALAAHPGLRQAAVTAVPDPAGSGLRLVAHLVGREAGAPPPPPEALRAFLRERLPPAMIPAVFVAAASLPLLPSGKVDRRALPPPPEEGARAAPPTAAAAPRDETEAGIAAIWAEVLRREAVGVADNFFDAGGDSLLAMQVLARIRRRFETDIPIRALFDAPTIEGLAREVRRARGAGRTAPRRPRMEIRPREDATLDALAAELGKLSPEQIERLLRQLRTP